jgi:Mg-chelatase subunit ChlI
MERNLGFEADPVGFHHQWENSEADLSHQIEKARQLLDQVTYTKRDLLSIAALTSSLNVDGHRADLVILKTARAHAAFEGRTTISERDIVLAAELALPHRIRKGPFQQAEITMEELQERIEELQGEASVAGEPVPVPDDQPASDKKKA